MRRLHRRLLVVAVVCLLATGCSRSEERSDEQSEASRPGEVRIAAAEDIWPLFGPGPRSRTFAQSPNLNVYEALVSLNPDHTLRPALAERWEFLEPNTWRFHRREIPRRTAPQPFIQDWTQLTVVR